MYSPSFVGKDNNVMATLYGYESLGALFFYDRDDKVPKFFDFNGDDLTFPYSQGALTTLTSSGLRNDATNEYTPGSLLFNYNELGYSFMKGSKQFNGGYLIQSNAYDGVNTGAYIQYTEVWEGSYSNAGIKVCYKYNYATKEFSSRMLLVPQRSEAQVVGVLKDGSSIISVKNGS